MHIVTRACLPLVVGKLAIIQLLQWRHSTPPKSLFIVHIVHLLVTICFGTTTLGRILLVPNRNDSWDEIIDLHAHQETLIDRCLLRSTTVNTAAKCPQLRDLLEGGPRAFSKLIPRSPMTGPTPIWQTIGGLPKGAADEVYAAIHLDRCESHRSR